ncbi:GspE/PulE family protein [Clostridium sp.]|uniref:GspE/PulE family protein n=1 Tax=Clostridium sp. TaxID=1506 RepID=UPI00241F43CF|nr:MULTISPECIES: ATPase, T2SS/T4P/T4SS family [Clostridium]MDU4726656.1 ATPase, T2SS/T4P/T4SS family [Clostridium sp.]
MYKYSVEVTMKGINQVNLNYKIGLTFVEGLRSLLRQDPNVIMVGEIRDEETAKMAVRSAITGHKVYSTIHTKSPREVYLRLEEMGVKGYLIKDALVGIISQRLIKLLCKCKEEIGVIDLNGESIEIYKKCGCNICNNSGYIGRQLIASVYHIDKKLKGELSKIYEKEDLLSNCQMVSSLRDLLLKGVIDYYDYLSILEGEELNED